MDLINNEHILESNPKPILTIILKKLCIHSVSVRERDIVCSTFGFAKVVIYTSTLIANLYNLLSALVYPHTSHQCSR